MSFAAVRREKKNFDAKDAKFNAKFRHGIFAACGACFLA
jgi:hypothetical protein